MKLEALRKRLTRSRPQAKPKRPSLKASIERRLRCNCTPEPTWGMSDRKSYTGPHHMRHCPMHATRHQCTCMVQFEESFSQDLSDHMIDCWWRMVVEAATREAKR